MTFKDWNDLYLTNVYLHVDNVILTQRNDPQYKYCMQYKITSKRFNYPYTPGGDTLCIHAITFIIHRVIRYVFIMKITHTSDVNFIPAIPNSQDNKASRYQLVYFDDYLVQYCTFNLVCYFCQFGGMFNLLWYYWLHYHIFCRLHCWEEYPTRKSISWTEEVLHWIWTWPWGSWYEMGSYWWCHKWPPGVSPLH